MRLEEFQFLQFFKKKLVDPQVCFFVFGYFLPLLVIIGLYSVMIRRLLQQVSSIHLRGNMGNTCLVPQVGRGTKGNTDSVSQRTNTNTSEQYHSELETTRVSKSKTSEVHAPELYLLHNPPWPGPSYDYAVWEEKFFFFECVVSPDYEFKEKELIW